MRKSYVHARLRPTERAVLDDLITSTGLSESEILRRGLRLVAEEERTQRNALQTAGSSVGRFWKGPPDLSTNRRHLEGFGE
jgi:hypothetical protein